MTNKHIGSNFDDFLKEEGLIMTTDIERQFFDTFGIEPKEQEIFVLKRMIVKEYPQISDRILLELICILGSITIKSTPEQCELFYADGAISYLGTNLKEAILNLLISKASIFKHQVQALFKEG